MNNAWLLCGESTQSLCAALVWCDKPAVAVSQMCTLACSMNGKGWQMGRGVNSLENSNEFN